MKLNIQKFKDGGLPNKNVATFGLPEVNIYPQNEFGDIARSQGIRTARNWRTVKEGTTKGINDFYNDPRTQMVMAGLPLPSMLDAAGDAIKVVGPIIKNSKVGKIVGNLLGPKKQTIQNFIKDHPKDEFAQWTTMPEKYEWLNKQINPILKSSISYDKQNLGGLTKISDTFLEIIRRSTLPKTKNIDVINTMDDFYNRVSTPEGLKRAKNLGIDKSELLKRIDVVDDPHSYGSYSGTKIYSNPQLKGNLAKNTTRHELEHHVQNLSGNNTTIIDDSMKDLELRSAPIIRNNTELKPKRIQKKDVDINVLGEQFNDNKQGAINYFMNGSDGAESSAMLSEVQQYMLNNKFINHAYDKITPENVKDAFIKGYYDREEPVRVFKIMKPNENNYKLISDNLNRMLTTIPIAGGLNYLNKNKDKNK